MKRITLQMLLMGVAAAALWAQSRVAEPISGFVFDGRARVLRPVLGIPGAALLGDPLEVGGALQAAYVAPRQDTALVVATGGTRLVRLNGRTASPMAWEGLAGAPERVAFSPSGTAAAWYAGGRVHVIAGLPDAPVTAGAVDLGSAERAFARFARRGRAPAAAMAVSDDGRYLLAVVGGAVRLFGLAGENFSVLNVGAGAMVAFAPGGHDAAAADASSGIVLLRDVAGTGAQRVLVAPDAAMAAPAGLAFTADGGRLLVAGASGVTAFDVGTGERSAIGCNCAPAGLFPMGDLFRLNEAGAAPLWLLDARQPDPRIVFVPVRAE